MQILLIGILINTFAFGLMGLTSKQSGVPHLLPKFLVNTFVDSITMLVYGLSFLIILLSPINLFLRILIAVLMQFFVNHMIWGLVVGTIAGIDAKRRLNKTLEQYK